MIAWKLGNDEIWKPENKSNKEKIEYGQDGAGAVMRNTGAIQGFRDFLLINVCLQKH